MRKVFALFRNPASYIDPLLDNFSEKSDLFVAFSVEKPHGKSSLDGFEHVFLKHSGECKYREGKDYELVQRDVKDYISARDYDFVFIATSYWSPTTWIAIHEAQKRDIPMMTRMTTALDKRRNGILDFIKKILVTTYCKKMDAAVYECDEQRRYLLKYGMHEDQLFFAPCAVNNEYFSAQRDSYIKNDVRAKLNIKNDELMVIFVGQLISRKRPLDIIQAIHHLSKMNKKVKLFILGEGPLKSEISKYVMDNALTANVFLCGKVDHEILSKYLSASDVYVLPSEFDASPKALNEAMNFQLPILISDGIKTAKEMCRIGENGYVFEVGNVNEIVNYLSIFLDNMNLIESMGKRSREIVKQYSFDAVTDAWIDAIEYGIRRKREGND